MKISSTNSLFKVEPGKVMTEANLTESFGSQLVTKSVIDGLNTYQQISIFADNLVLKCLNNALRITDISINSYAWDLASLILSLNKTCKSSSEDTYIHSYSEKLSSKILKSVLSPTKSSKVDKFADQLSSCVCDLALKQANKNKKKCSDEKFSIELLRRCFGENNERFVLYLNFYMKLFIFKVKFTHCNMKK